MESRTIGADEVAEALGMSCAYAYKLIRRLNCVSSRGFEQKEHRKLSSLSIGSA